MLSADSVGASLPSEPRPCRRCSAGVPGAGAEPEAKAWEEMVKKILGDAKPIEGKW